MSSTETKVQQNPDSKSRPTQEFEPSRPSSPQSGYPKSTSYNAPLRRVGPSIGDNVFLVSQDLSEDLKAAYQEIRSLCEEMDTSLSTHSFARELYESVYQSAEFVSESQKTVISACLFIAYEATDTDSTARERRIFYYERSHLAPDADDDALRVFTALDNFFGFRASSVIVRKGHEGIGLAAIDDSELPQAAEKEDESKSDTASAVGDSFEPLVEVYTAINTFCECLPMPSHVSRHVAAHCKLLYEQVHSSGGFRPDEQLAVVAGCLYLALRQSGTPRAVREVWIVTGVLMEEVEAVVQDLENFFEGEYGFERNGGEEGGGQLYEQKTVSSLDGMESVDVTKAVPETAMPVIEALYSIDVFQGVEKRTGSWYGTIRY